MGLSPLGGVPSWSDDLIPYSSSTVYPTGTVFVLPCTDEDPQGHVALMTPWGLLEAIPQGGIVLNATQPQDWATSTRGLLTS